MKKLLILFFLIFPVISNCKKENQEDTGLINVRWVLEYIQNTTTNAITEYPTDAGKDISLVFTDSKDVITFSGICNNGSGTFSYSKKTGDLEIKNLLTTLIGCQNNEWETYTVQNLIDAYGYKLDGNNLIIFSIGEYNLFFRK